MKPDLGKFGFNKRDWKVTPKQKSYYDNYDKIFRKEKCKCNNCNCMKENFYEKIKIIDKALQENI